MATHDGRTKEAPKPIRWCSIVQTDEGWHCATMETVNGKPGAQHLGPAGTKDQAEEAFRVWAGENLMGWEVE
jgi:hypothetical protein